MDRHTWLQVLKVGVGSAISIVIAQFLHLDYATSAGIVTLLTIQNTKRATYQIALSRVVSFVVAAVVAVFCVWFVPSREVGFGIFMLILVSISYKRGWHSAISVNAVIGTHLILMETSIGPEIIISEAAMVLIGTAVAIVLNLTMFSQEKEMRRDIDYVESYIYDNLHFVANHLDNHSQLDKDREHLQRLIEHIDEAIDKAIINQNNIMKSHAEYYIHYLRMRKNQCAILIHFYYIVAHHEFIVEEATIVAAVVRKVAKKLDVQSETHNLKHQIDSVNDKILHLNMPKTYTEFEMKAVLYSLLNELREFLWIQEEFVENVTEEQREAYWEKVVHE